MGITSHTRTHALKHTKIFPFFFFLVHSEEKWMDVTGRRRTQWRHTCFLLHLLPLLLVCHFFSAHSQTSWHTLCLWEGIMLSQSRRVFPAHQRSDTTHRAGFPTPLPHHFFITSWSERVQPGRLIRFNAEANVSLSKGLCCFSSFFSFQYLLRLDHQIKTMSHLLWFLVMGCCNAGSCLINKTFETNLFKVRLLPD